MFSELIESTLMRFSGVFGILLRGVCVSDSRHYTQSPSPLYSLLRWLLFRRIDCPFVRRRDGSRRWQAAFGASFIQPSGFLNVLS